MISALIEAVPQNRVAEAWRRPSCVFLGKGSACQSLHTPKAKLSPLDFFGLWLGVTTSLIPGRRLLFEARVPMNVPHPPQYPPSFRKRSPGNVLLPSKPERPLQKVVSIPTH